MAASEWWDDLDVEQLPTLERLLARRMPGHVLVTCRVPVRSWPVEVGPQAPELAPYFLLERSGQDDRASAADVARLLEAGSIHIFNDRA